ncbi:MAG TPA: DUF11 domain-containing protein [Conexibacter sp.]
MPATPRTIYAEDFENGAGVTELETYPSSSGATYGADLYWLTASHCNGFIMSFGDTQPVGACGDATTEWGSIQSKAYALGLLNTPQNPAANRAISTNTTGGDGAPGTYPLTPGMVEFSSSQLNLPAASGRFVTFSVDAAATACELEHPLMRFFLRTVSGQEVPVSTSAIDPCTDPRSQGTVAFPLIFPAGQGVSYGRYPADSSQLLSGSSFGIVLRNESTSANGDDGAIDNIRVLDVTPSLDKSFSPADLNAGQTSTLTFTVTNTSELAAKDGWSFTDSLPAGLVIAGPSNARTTCTNGNVTAGAGASAITVSGDLDAGQASCTVSVDVTSSTAGTYTNGPGNVTTTGLNPPTDTTVRFRAADLSVVKTATSPAAVPGTDVSYDLVVRNDGPDTAVNASLTDPLPAGLTFKSASSGCTGSAQNVTCAIGDLPAGQSRTYTVTASVAADLPAGELDNTANVRSDTTDPDPGNNTSTSREPVDPQADLSIVKRASADRPVPGRELTYTLTVTNSGPSLARAITVSDPLPRGLSFVSADGACKLSDGTVTCTAASLAVRRSLTFRVVTRVATSVTDRITNTATVTSSTRDPDPRDNRSTVDVPSGPEADLSITKVPSVDHVAVGGQLFYTLIVRNDGPSDAQNVTVTDTPAAGLTTLGASASQGTCSLDANRASCRIGTVAAGGTAQVLVSARADQAGDLSNSATVDSTTHDSNPGDNSDTRRVTGDPAPPPQPADVGIVKTANKRTVLGAGTITYTLKVTNHGPAAAPGTQVIDTPSLPMKVGSVKSSQGSCTTTAPIRCDLGTLQNGQTVTIKVVGQPLRAGTLKNSASVTSDVPDPNIRNNLDGTTVMVRGLLKITKVASAKTVHAGGTLSYRVTVTNASSFALRSVKVSDNLPSGLVFDSASPKAKLSHGEYCWTITSLRAKAHKAITVRVRVLRGVGGRKVNVATATAPNARGARSKAATGTASIRVLAAQRHGGGVTG